MIKRHDDWDWLVVLVVFVILVGFCMWQLDVDLLSLAR